MPSTQIERTSRAARRVGGRSRAPAAGGSGGRLGMPRPWQRPDIILASLSINILGLGLPLAILQVYDRVLPSAGVDTFGVIIVGLCGIILVEAALRIIRARIVSWIGARFEHRLSGQVFDRLLETDLLALEQNAAGVQLDRVQAIDTLREFYAGPSATILLDMPFVAVFLALIWFIAGPLVIAPVVLILLFSLLSWILTRRIHEATEQRSDVDERRYNFLIETLSGIHTVKSLAMEPQMLRRYESLQAGSAARVHRLTRLTGLSQSLGALFAQAAAVSVVAIGAIQVVDGRLTIGAVAASMLLTSRCIQPILRGVGMWTQFQGVSLAGHKVREILALGRPAQAALPPPAIGGPASFAVDRVTFAYPGQGRPLLEDASFAVEPGEAVGITGDNSSGKSTLGALLIALVAPERGRILFNGVDIATLDPAQLRRQIGYIPHKGALFQGTLLDNLTMFRDGSYASEAIELAEEIGLTSIVRRLPQGFATIIGESAALALGESARQQIAIVRGLLGSPPAIIFDDANQGLDRQADEALRAALERRRGKTSLVIISHRPSLLALTDRTYRIEDGQIRALEPSRPGPARPQMLRALAPQMAG